MKNILLMVVILFLIPAVLLLSAKPLIGGIFLSVLYLGGITVGFLLGRNN